MESLDDLHLVHRLESIFCPAESWEKSLLQLNTQQVLVLVSEKYPKLFNEDNLPNLLEQMHVKNSFNEHNGKHYWLLNYV